MGNVPQRGRRSQHSSRSKASKSGPVSRADINDYPTTPVAGKSDANSMESGFFNKYAAMDEHDLPTKSGGPLTTAARAADAARIDRERPQEMECDNDMPLKPSRPPPKTGAFQLAATNYV